MKSRSFAALRRSFVLCAMGVACSRPDAGRYDVTLDTTRGVARASVAVQGIFHDDDFSRVRVSLAGDTTPILGSFALDENRDGVLFAPRFPFDRARAYEVAVDGVIVGKFQLPPATPVAPARVTRIYPTPDVLPENLLRLYVEFSAPMSTLSGLPYVKLLDDAGREVKNAFLPLDANFWDGDRRRYTLFLDPGRVKRGILPNEAMGRALVSGRRYSIVVDSTWPDGWGKPLAASYRKDFRASAADYKPLALAGWKVEAPLPNTRSQLVIHLPKALDYGLLRRAVGVETESGTSVSGDADVPQGEREWRFTPTQPWTAGAYRVVVLDFLEDVAGNRVNRAFEVDVFTHADSTTKPSRYTIPFRIR